jgi:hypothetical protein
VIRNQINNRSATDQQQIKNQIKNERHGKDFKAVEKHGNEAKSEVVQDERIVGFSAKIQNEDVASRRKA